jgi:hypothetical protein
MWAQKIIACSNKLTAIQKKLKAAQSSINYKVTRNTPAA